MNLTFKRILEDRRDGRRHSLEDLKSLANGAAAGSIPDYQLSAWLMAEYLNPLKIDETVGLTQAMAESGERVDLSGLPRPWVDKHSTGGVGDKTTIVVLPLLAACGLTVVKMSGPGLGITGGTIDKLASIPGFRVSLTVQELVAQAQEIGIALTGQTADLAPADKVLYALRDATSTVESVPLIVSSILSKKIAGGADTIFIDVKCGSGAFMSTLSTAEELALSLRQVGERCGLKVSLAITDMEQPLGSAVGNALEVREALSVLKGGSLSGPTRRFRDLCVGLARETLLVAGVEADVEAVLQSGTAARKAEAWIAAQGGPKGLERVSSSLPAAPVREVVCASESGWVAEVNAGAIGRAAVDLGAGRRQKGDPIDPAVGFEFDCMVGSRVEAGERLLTVHAGDEERAAAAIKAGRGAIRLSGTPVEVRPVILKSF